MKKKKNEVKNKALQLAALLLAVLVVGSVVAVAYTGQNAGTVIEGDCNNCTTAAPSNLPSFGAVVEDDDANEDIHLDFSAAATTTPGGLFRYTNGRTAKLCTLVQLDITTATSQGGILGTGAPLEFSVATSTSPSAISGNIGIVASTTLATSTTGIIDSVVYPGTYVGADQDIGGATFELGAGVSIIGQFDAYIDTTTRTSATSSDTYAGVVGKAYITCRNR